MTTNSEQGEAGGSVEAEASTAAGPAQAQAGADAAEAAGFGGVTWADETADESGSVPASPDEADPSAQQGDGGAGPDPTEISVEDLVQDLERVSLERDQYLDASRRIQAEFENYKKAVAKRELEARERANESLVNEILPVLDACDGAVASGASDVEPVRAALVEALTKQGLERIDDQDSAFDPARHDAVMHEPADSEDGPLVAEIMRAGYSWKGRVVRPAMVRVRG